MPDAKFRIPDLRKIDPSGVLESELCHLELWDLETAIRHSPSSPANHRPGLAPMPTINARDFLYLAPEIALTAWGLIVLTIDFALLRRRSSEDRQGTLGWLTLAGVGLTFLVTIRYIGLYMDATSLSGGASWL